MLELIAISIPRTELKEYKDYVNYLFKAENSRLNICRTEEDVQKSNQWFKNFPLRTLIVSKSPIKVGDKFIAECINQELHNKVFKYLGVNKEGVDIIDIKDENGKRHISTKHLLTNAKKVERNPTLEELMRVVNKQSLDIFKESVISTK